MKTKVETLTKSEEQMMDIFWDSDGPLTSVDIIKMKVRDTWGNGLVHNILRSLVQKGMLKECGLEHCYTQYARKLAPTMTREEYAAKEQDEDGEMISELEEIIQQMRGNEE